MPNVFIDDIFAFFEYDIDTNQDIIESILETRKDFIDRERFFLKYISREERARYDFSDTNSLSQFRNINYSFMTPVKGMGGCNLREDMLAKDIRYAGIKLSDPDGKILGQFDIRNHIITYSPIFPLFYEQRDLIKFANDTYITTITFKEIILNQIKYAKKFYIHTGNCKTLEERIKYGDYILKQINEEEMIDYATNPDSGAKVLKKYMKVDD